MIHVLAWTAEGDDIIMTVYDDVLDKIVVKRVGQ